MSFLIILDYGFIIISAVFSIHFIIVTTNLLKSRYKEKLEKYEPFTSVIIPCKGSSDEFRKFLECINSQDYKNAEYLFCLSDKKDKAIKDIINIIKRDYKIIISKNIPNSCDKNQNQIAGVNSISKKAKIVLFLDSDGTFNNSYIRSLIKPLQDKRYTCSSSYRKYNSTKLGGLMIKYWNLISLSFKLFPQSSFAWAGGMAFRREDLNKAGIPNAWKDTLSDDMAVNKIMNAKGLKTISLPLYAESINHKGLFESLKWITRQSVMPYIYYKKLYFLNVLSSLVFIMSIVMFAMSMNILYLIFPLSVFMGIIILSFIHGNTKETLLSPYIFLLVIICIGYPTLLVPFKKKIEWAGITYEIDSSGKIINRR